MRGFSLFELLIVIAIIAVLGAMATPHMIDAMCLSRETGAGLLQPDLTSGAKNGYRFTMEPTAEGYAIHAQPVRFGVSGRRTFYSAEDAAVHQSWAADAATVESALAH